MLLGNAAAPRWYDLDDVRLEQYLGFLTGCGATSAEFVLHHGAMDPRGARVHLLRPDWTLVSEAFQDAGFSCQLHASLDPRFALSRWGIDRQAVQAEHRPLIEAAIAIGERQSTPATFVVHATSSRLDQLCDGVSAAQGYLEWAAGVMDSAGANVVLCPELRPARGAADRRWDRSRTEMVRVISSLDRRNIGICWDLGHDWENRNNSADWSTAPSDQFLELVRHVHVHDAGPAGELHHPLGAGRVPWADQLRLLRDRKYGGAVTMEIRYRYALTVGEPWTVLALCYRRALEQLA